MNIRHEILLLLLANNENKIEKNRFKQLFYFFSIKIDCDYNYYSHPFGPISNIVEKEIEQSISAGFINILKNNINKYDCSYSLTENGRKFALTLVADNRKENIIIEDFIKKTYAINNISTSILIIATKILFYLNKKYEKITIKNIKKVMTGSVLTHKRYENDIIEIFKIFELLENNKNERK